MASSNSGNDQFFEFQAQLEYSAIYYSTLALRHMQINSENPSAPSPQNSASRISKKPPQPNPYLPVITVDVEDYGEQAEGLKKNKSRRKVNFAHPLSVVKIKSPTPIHSLEDLGNVIAACNNSMQDTWENPLQQQISNCVYYSDSSDSDVEAVIAPPNFDVGNTYSSYVPSSGNDNVCGAEPTSSRKKKRRKRKKSKDDSMYSLDSSSNAGFNPDDPYAIYAVPLNEGDYEFVSDIRLCTDDDMTKLESDSSSISPIESDEDETVEANKNPHKEDAPNNYEDKEKLLKEMKQLYGDMGSERIHQMEEAIESYFFNQLVNST